MATRMSKRTRLIIIILTAAVLVAVGATVGVALNRNSASPPDLTLPIITWNETSLSELEGAPVILNFWSISCPYCVRQLPYLENVAQQTDGEMEVVAVNMVDSASRIRAFFVDYEPTMVIAVDENREAFKDYCLAYNNTRGSIPFTLFVDSEGVVQYVKIGAFASEAALWSAVHDVFGITIP